MNATPAHSSKGDEELVNSTSQLSISRKTSRPTTAPGTQKPQQKKLTTKKTPAEDSLEQNDPPFRIVGHRLIGKRLRFPLFNDQGVIVVDEDGNEVSHIGAITHFLSSEDVDSKGQPAFTCSSGFPADLFRMTYDSKCPITNEDGVDLEMYDLDMHARWEEEEVGTGEENAASNAAPTPVGREVDKSALESSDEEEEVGTGVESSLAASNAAPTPVGREVDKSALESSVESSLLLPEVETDDEPTKKKSTKKKSTKKKPTRYTKQPNQVVHYDNMEPPPMTGLLANKRLNVRRIIQMACGQNSKEVCGEKRSAIVCIIQAKAGGVEGISYTAHTVETTDKWNDFLESNYNRKDQDPDKEKIFTDTVDLELDIAGYGFRALSDNQRGDFNGVGYMNRHVRLEEGEHCQNELRKMPYKGNLQREVNRIMIMRLFFKLHKGKNVPAEWMPDSYSQPPDSDIKIYGYPTFKGTEWKLTPVQELETIPDDTINGYVITMPFTGEPWIGWDDVGNGNMRTYAMSFREVGNAMGSTNRLGNNIDKALNELDAEEHKKDTVTIKYKRKTACAKKYDPKTDGTFENYRSKKKRQESEMKKPATQPDAVPPAAVPPAAAQPDAIRGIEGINSVLRGSPVSAPRKSPHHAVPPQPQPQPQPQPHPPSAMSVEYAATPAGYAPTPDHYHRRGGQYNVPAPAPAAVGSSSEVMMTPAAPTRRGGAGKENAANEGASRVPCTCKNSKCLKLYCICFAAEKYCFGCKCTNCQNTPQFDAIRNKAISDTKAKNPKAFVKKMSETTHSTGCRCKRSACLKKYCECFQAGIVCGPNCKCINCKNFVGSQALIDRRRKIKDHKGAEVALKSAEKVWKRGTMSDTKVAVRSGPMQWTQSPIVHAPGAGGGGGAAMTSPMPAGPAYASPHHHQPPPPPPGYYHPAHYPHHLAPPPPPPPPPGLIQQPMMYEYHPQHPYSASRAEEVPRQQQEQRKPQRKPPSTPSYEAPIPTRTSSFQRRLEAQKRRDEQQSERKQAYFGPDVSSQTKKTTLSVFSYLTNEDLFNASIVSKKWCDAAFDNDLWRTRHRT